jgi:hypothetical protein
MVVATIKFTQPIWIHNEVTNASEKKKRGYEPITKVRNFALEAPKLENPKPTQKNKEFGRMNNNNNNNKMGYNIKTLKHIHF